MKSHSSLALVALAQLACAAPFLERRQFGEQGANHFAPSAGFPAPSGGFAAASGGLGAPFGGFPAPSAGFPAPSGGFAAPSGGFAAGGFPTGSFPSGSFAAPSGTPSLQARQFGEQGARPFFAPSGGFPAPSAGFPAPSGGFAAPSGGFPSGGFPTGAFPSGGFAAPSGTGAPNLQARQFGEQGHDHPFFAPSGGFPAPSGGFAAPAGAAPFSAAASFSAAAAPSVSVSPYNGTILAPVALASGTAVLLSTGVASSAAAASTAAAAGSATTTDGPIGYASTNGGTTGGQGGTTTTVSSLAQFTAAVTDDDTAAVIVVSGTITGSTQVRVGSNKSIIGADSSAGLVGIGLYIKGVSNVIVRNLAISKVLADNGDAIGIQASTNVWVDHCDLSSDRDHDKDFYDGLCDITHASDWVTVSNTYFHDHFKASLVGHSDSNGDEDTGFLHVTYANNYWSNINSRTPSIRFGTGHIFNSYFDTMDTGVNTRMGAQVLVESNVFVDVSSPLESEDSDETGSAVSKDNDFGSGSDTAPEGTLTTVPYDYTVLGSDAVKAAVVGTAGNTLTLSG